MKHMYGGALEYRPPVEGLRLRFSGWTHEASLDSRSTVTGFLGPLPATFLIDTHTDLSHDYWLIASAEYQRGGLRLSAEHSWLKLTTTTTVSGLPTGPLPASTSVTRPSGWYVQAAQRLGDKLQLSGYYSHYFEDADDGADLVRGTSTDFERWDKDLAFTTRLDLGNHFLVKAEFHAIDGAARLGVVENPQGLTQKWNLFAVRGTVHF
jgi:hypothetical protein